MFIMSTGKLCNPFWLTMEKFFLSVGVATLVLRTLEHLSILVPKFGIFVTCFVKILKVVPIFLMTNAIFAWSITLLFSTFFCDLHFDQSQAENITLCEESKWYEAYLTDSEGTGQNLTLSEVHDKTKYCFNTLFLDAYYMPLLKKRDGRTPLVDENALKCYSEFISGLTRFTRFICYLAIYMAVLKAAMLKYLLDREEKEMERLIFNESKFYLMNCFNEVKCPVPWNLFSEGLDLVTCRGKAEEEEEKLVEEVKAVKNDGSNESDSSMLYYPIVLDTDSNTN